MSGEQSIIFVIDDDASMRASIESLLLSVGHATRTFATAKEFVLGERPEVPACLVLDVRLPGRSGLEFQQELARSDIRLPIVFITGHGDVAMTVSAMKAGAVEFLTKPFRDQDLLDAVHRALDIDRERRAETVILRELRQRFGTLTPREREVMTLVVAGELNKQIAAALDLSEITVKVHRAQVMRKMQAKSLPDLVRIADRLAADKTKS
jgi:FixJ family two-component response regulator